MSENPFKGVPGGDPRLRVQNAKTLVSISYLCPSCNQQKSEKFPEGKDLTGRICVDCRNAEGVRKQKEQREEAERRWAKARRKTRNTPIRTKAEKLALIKEWEHAPKERCASCGGMCFVADPAMPFYNDNWDRPNAIRVVMYVNDPFDYEVRGVERTNWYCRRCNHELAMDI